MRAPIKILSVTGTEAVDAGALAGHATTKTIEELLDASSIGEGLRDIAERGVDAHVADLETATAPKKKRKSRSSYSARTIAECVKRGWIAGNVERRIPFPKPRGTTIDLFGVIDVIAVDMTAPEGQRTIGIQTTSGGTSGSLSPHRAKMLAETRMLTWIAGGNRLELWTWALQGVRGKAKRWRLRVERFGVVDGEMRVVEVVPS